MYLRAFPDAQWSVEDIIVQGDKAAWRERFTGTHQGELMGIPATGKKVDVTGISMGLLRDGKPAIHWSVYDNLGMMQQLGVVPTPGQPQ